MPKNVKKLLQELYKIDPDLKNQEEELVQVIQKLLKHQPDTKFDSAFAVRLKQELEDKISGMQVESGEESSSVSVFQWWWKAFYLGAGAVATLLILTPFLVRPPSENFIPESDEETVAQDSVPEPLFTGGGVSSKIDRDGAAPTFVNNKMVVEDEMMISSPEIKIVYAGESVPKLPAQMKGFERIKGSLSAENKLLNLPNSKSLLNLQNFQNIQIQNLNLAQTQEDGYVINVDLEEERANIHQSNLSHEDLFDLCPTEHCMKIKDEDLIKITADFTTAYQIDLTPYGSPEIVEMRKNARSGAGRPKEVTILYPLKINERLVINESGRKRGLELVVNIVDSKVTKVSNLQTQNWQEVEYQLEQNWENILQKVKEQAGVFYWNDEAVLKIGTPTLNYLSKSEFDEQTNRFQEVLIPAYGFPVLNGRDEGLSVIVVEITQKSLNHD